VTAPGRVVGTSSRLPFALRLPRRRRRAAWVLAVAGPLLITLGSRLVGSAVPPASILFASLLVVVIVALIGGVRPALTAVLVGLLAQEILFSFPYGSLANHEPVQLTVLVGFVVIGAAVGILVDELSWLTEEQAALRRIAILVATEARTDELFSAVAEEVGRLFPADIAGMARYESDGAVTIVAAWGRAGDQFGVGSSFGLEGTNHSTLVAEARRPVRFDSSADASGGVGSYLRAAGVRSAVGAPIVVEGRPWGLMIAGSTREQRLPPDIEERLAGFTELLATAIANAESRAALARLADVQAALLRLATLVAQSASAGDVFAAAVAEAGGLLVSDNTTLARYEPDGTVTVVAAESDPPIDISVGMRLPPDGDNPVGAVLRTGQVSRMDSFADARGPIAELARQVGVLSAVGAPIVVDTRLWGVLVVSSRSGALPLDTEQRVANFTELVATAIANAESRAELAASRARVVAAADETRRQIERDLHDGAQQRLVLLGYELRVAQAAVPAELAMLHGDLSRVVEGLVVAQNELREMARGIHPASLAESGLGPALKALARRSPIPVELNLGVEDRLPERVEVATYYVVSETLTNAAKHARASILQVDVEVAGGTLRACIRDDGVGGADPAHGSGLVGLRDRVEALGGTIAVKSRDGEGTAVTVALPVSAEVQ
jgi:signal transduction histidine kinase